MVTPMTTIFSRSLEKFHDNGEKDYFSSNASEEDNNDLIRKKNKKKKRNSILNLEPHGKEVFPDKREDNISNLNELRRIHNSKVQKLKNEKIGWNLIYKLLFSEYFNYIHDRRPKSDYSFFNIKETELRIKKMINKIKNKKNYKDNINNKEEGKMEFPTPKWINRSFVSILNDFKYDEKEKNDFIPTFIESFKNYFDNDKKHHRNRSKPLLSNFTTPKTNISNVTPSSNLSLKHNNTLIGHSSSLVQKRKSMAFIDPLFTFTKKDQKILGISSLKTNSNRNQNKGIILNINFKTRDNINKNINNIPNIDLLKTNKKFYDILVNKYPKYEEDILNIKNNFIVSDIELNKNESIFKRPENFVVKHFFDFHLDNKEKDIKKYTVSDILVKKSETIDNFIRKFTNVMNSKGKRTFHNEIITE